MPISEHQIILDILEPLIPKKHQQLIGLLSQYIQQTFSQKEQQHFLKKFNVHGKEWGFQAKHPLAQHVIAKMIEKMFGTVPIQGLSSIHDAMEQQKKGKHITFIGNHLSYGDINFLSSQLDIQNISDLPLLVMAGPKVYQDPFRKFSSMAFDTLKMAQPPSRASEEAHVSMRDLAEITRNIISETEKQKNKGKMLYFFPEGSRTRSGAMNRFIPASARYLDSSNNIIYPIGFCGTENLLGINSDTISAKNVEIKIGKGISIDHLNQHLPDQQNQRRRVLMDLLGFAVADQLPKKLKGVYDLKTNHDQELEEAKKIYLTELECSLD